MRRELRLNEDSLALSIPVSFFLSGVSSEKGKVKYLSVFFACSLFAISRNAALPSGQSKASDSRNVVRMLALLTAVAPSFQWLLHFSKCAASSCEPSMRMWR